MSEIWESLDKLGLACYADQLVAEGFDTWATLCDITESDLTDLNFKLGHRRKLQRAIAERSRQSPVSRIPLLPLVSASHIEPDGLLRQSVEILPTQTSHKPGGELDEPLRTKRKYRRHPKADVCAPERPPSAYVIFSNHMREILKDREHSFTEMAKCVGEKWQELPPDERERFERQASTVKEKYLAELAEYKKTENYRLYQEYLADFKAKNGKVENVNDTKRAKLEAESSVSTQGSLDNSEMGRTKSGASSYTVASTPPDSEPYQDSNSPPKSYHPKMQFPERKMHRYKSSVHSTSPPLSTLPYDSIHDAAWPKTSTSESPHMERSRNPNHPGVLAPYAAPLEPLSRLPSLTDSKTYTHALLLNAPSYRTPQPHVQSDDAANSSTILPGFREFDAARSRRILPAPMRQSTSLLLTDDLSPAILATSIMQPYVMTGPKNQDTVPLSYGIDDGRGSSSLAALLRAGEELAAMDEGVIASLDRSAR